MREHQLTSQTALSVSASSGFSLLEVLISIVFLTVVIVTVLQSMSYCLKISEEVERQWRDSLLRWNRVQQLRSGQELGGVEVHILPGGRPMFYQEVRTEVENHGEYWGVLRAAK